MKVIEMKLKCEYFNYIKNGTKRIEIRLNDEKRRDILVGDIIRFKNEDNLEYLSTRVKNIYLYNNFNELVDNFDIELLADKDIKKDKLLNDLNQIYSDAMQEVYGVIAIEIEIMDTDDLKIDSIRNYIDFDNMDNFYNVSDDIYKLASDLEKMYPEYRIWFYEKQLQGCLNENRDILFIRNNIGMVIGFSCLKNYDNEKKICSLYVNECYRKCGIGSLLIKRSIEILGTSKPLISCNERVFPMFREIIKKYDWKSTSIKDNLYLDDVCEYFFNENN